MGKTLRARFYGPLCIARRAQHTSVQSVLFSIFFTRDSIYAIARICYRPSVRPSVCLSHGYIIEKRLKLGL